ncbi:hypothetical protein ACWEOE_35775 [Amycolatopsis sp. NPDC004368]
MSTSIAATDGVEVLFLGPVDANLGFPQNGRQPVAFCERLQ